MDIDKVKKGWQKKIAIKLLGRKIVKVEYVSEIELKDMGWYKSPIVLYLDDGSYIMPMTDDEGNDGGALATGYKELPTIPVINI